MKKTLYQTTLFFLLIFSVNGVFAQGTRDEGVELYRQGKFSEAISVLQRLSKQKETKSDAMVWNYLGLSYMDSDDLKKARKALEKAVDLQPQSSAFRVNLAYVYLGSRQVNKAQTQIERAIQIDPQNATAYFLRGSARIREGKLEEAVADADKIISINPSYAGAYTLKSSAYMYIFGKRVDGALSAKSEIQYLKQAIDTLEYCVTYCKNNNNLAVQKDRLESLKVFYNYFMKESPLPLDVTVAAGVDAAGENTPIKIMGRPQARYTDRARQAGTQGTVNLYVLFASSGRVTFIIPLNSLGNGLDEEAMKAASQITFEPQRKNGVPVSVVRRVSYSFTIY